MRGFHPASFLFYFFYFLMCFFLRLQRNVSVLKHCLVSFFFFFFLFIAYFLT